MRELLTKSAVTIGTVPALDKAGSSSLPLNVPVIITDVSDARNLVDNKYGIVVEKSDNGIYDGMKKALNNKLKTTKFDPIKYNQNIIKKLESVINND